MTVSNDEVRTSVVGDGTAQVIPFTFPVTLTSDIDVFSRLVSDGTQVELTETSDYTVSILGDTGGNVTMVTTFSSDYQIHVVRDTPNTQLMNLESGGDFDAENIEDAIDKNTKLTAESADSLNRTLIFPATDPASSFADMPNSVDRASKNLTFDSDGKPTASVAVAEGSVSFSVIGTQIVEAANALTERGILELDTGDDVEFAEITGTDIIGTGDITGSDIIGTGPWINVTHPDFGASPSASDVENFAAITAAIAAAVAGQTIYFPVGLYSISETLVITKKITLKGDVFRKGSGTETQLIWTQTNGTNGIEPTVAIAIEGIQLTGNALAGNGLHIDVGAPIGNFICRDMRSVSWGGHGLYGSELFLSEFYNCGILANEGDGVHLVESALNNFEGCQIEQNEDTADIYLDQCSTNSFVAQVGNGTATWGIYIEDTNFSNGNKFVIFHDGTTDRGIYFGDNSRNNEISYSGGTSHDVRDRGINNHMMNTRMPQIPTYQYASNSLPKVQNIVNNPSGVVDADSGWNTNDIGVTLARTTTDGVTTGTAHEIDWTVAATGKLAITNGSGAISTDDIIVFQFWAKLSRDLLTTEDAQIHLQGASNSTVSPQEGQWYDATTDWRFFSFSFVATDSIPAGVKISWEMDIANDITLFVTDVTMCINPDGMPSHVPFIFAGGVTEHVNYPLSHTGGLDQTMRLPNLDTAPTDPEPGAIAMADGMNWDPLATGTSCSELIFYGQAILVGDDYEWAKIGATDEYSVGLTGGGADPSFTEPDEVRINGVKVDKGARGSLIANTWAWGQDAGTSYDTVIVYLTGEADPDTGDDGSVTAMKWTAFGNEALK